MKTIKKHLVILLFLIATTSFAQKINLNVLGKTNVVLVVNDIEIPINQQVLETTTVKGQTKYHIANDDTNVIIKALKRNLKFQIRNKDNKNLTIKIVKLDASKSIQQQVKNLSDLSSDISFKSKKKDGHYELSIPKISKGQYAIIINGSTTCNVFNIK